MPVIGDSLWEGDETFIFELRNENANVDNYPATTTAVIVNDDTVDVRLTTADFSVDEDDPADIIYTVEIDQTLVGAETLTVQYRTVGGSATAGSDFKTPRAC